MILPEPQQPDRSLAVAGIIGVVVWLVLVRTAIASEAGLSFRPVSMVVSYERLTLPGDETLGLLGIHLLARHGKVYGGLAAFGAVTGQRGGFFTGGFEAGLRQPVSADWHLDIGLFAGAGGGGSAPQGGGMMLRSYAGLVYDPGAWRLGLGMTETRFPNGDIDSAQFSIAVERSFELVTVSDRVPVDRTRFSRFLKDKPVDSQKRLLGVHYWSYQPVAGTRDTTGAVSDSSFGLVGFDMSCYHSDHVYSAVQMAGAVEGSADGYAEVLLGLGWQQDWRTGWRWRNTLATGAAGGGGIATDNGLVARLTTGLQYRFARRWSMALDAGYMKSFSGDFQTRVIGLQLGNRYQVPVIVRDSAAASRLPSEQSWRPRLWRVRGSYLAYYPVGDSRRKNQSLPDRRRVDLLGAGIDLLRSGRQIYFSGSAAAAYDGGAGGYAVGLLGAGWRQPLSRDKRLNINAGLSFGAAGGGGLAVGGGLVWQAHLGLEYSLDRDVSAMLSGGRLAAPDGRLRADIIMLSLAYRFATLVSDD